jgi:hypothetical protein
MKSRDILAFRFTSHLVSGEQLSWRHLWNWNFLFFSYCEKFSRWKKSALQFMSWDIDTESEVSGSRGGHAKGGRSTAVLGTLMMSIKPVAHQISSSTCENLDRDSRIVGESDFHTKAFREAISINSVWWNVQFRFIIIPSLIQIWSCNVFSIQRSLFPAQKETDQGKVRNKTRIQKNLSGRAPSNIDFSWNGTQMMPWFREWNWQWINLIGETIQGLLLNSWELPITQISRIGPSGMISQCQNSVAIFQMTWKM